MEDNTMGCIYSVCSWGITLYNPEAGEMQELVINDIADNWQDLWAIAESIVGAEAVALYNKREHERWHDAESNREEAQ